MPELQVFGVVMRSPNGRDGWHPVQKQDVPAWVIGRMHMMVEGYMLNDPKEGKDGYWWRFEIHDASPPEGATIQ